MSASRYNSPTLSSAEPISRPAGVPGNPAGTLGEADLRRIESALLEALLDVHAGRANAVDELLAELSSADGAHDDTNALAQRDAGQSRRKQIEELLATAVLDTHPDRNRALDRILGELTEGGAGTVPPSTNWLA